MWISRNEYKNLKANIKCLENRYTAQRDINQSLLYDIDVYLEQIKQLEAYKSKAEEYKQKYADEVNKRLELIEFYEGKNNS